MTITTTTAKAFLEGRCCRQGHGKQKHTYTAKMEGRAIHVYDQDGQPVAVSFGGTMDNRSVYCHLTNGGGFIGGWQYPHKKMPWAYLADCINKGILYHDMNDLPKTHRAKICPHCGGEL